MYNCLKVEDDRLCRALCILQILILFFFFLELQVSIYSSPSPAPFFLILVALEVLPAAAVSWPTFLQPAVLACAPLSTVHSL